jgi:predicted RNase H-like HicB family nuclease
MGLIRANTRHDLHIIRRIRNEFAHEMRIKGFSHKGVASRCKEFRSVPTPEPDPRLRFILASALLLSAIEGVLLALRRRKEAIDQPGDRKAAYIPEMMCFRVEQAARFQAGTLTGADAQRDLAKFIDRMFGGARDSRAYAVLIEATDEGFTATVPDLPGCITTGQTVEEADNGARAAIDEWVGDAESNGRQVPWPHLRTRTLVVDVPAWPERVGRDS